MSQTTKRKRLDPAATRRDILTAAFKTFADKGFEAASIGDIAVQAGVRKSLVQYHFGTKEELWNTCLAERAQPIIEAIDSLLADETKKVSDLIIKRYQMLRDNPDVRRLLAWATIAPFPPPQFIRDRRDLMLKRLGDDPSDPRVVRFLFVLSAADGWLHFRSLYASVLGTDILGAKVEEELLQLIKEVAP